MTKTKDWFAVFQLLRKEIEKVPRSTKMIVFFDELPWLTSPRSMFLQASVIFGIDIFQKFPI